MTTATWLERCSEDPQRASRVRPMIGRANGAAMVPFAPCPYPPNQVEVHGGSQAMWHDPIWRNGGPPPFRRTDLATAPKASAT